MVQSPLLAPGGLFYSFHPETEPRPKICEQQPPSRAACAGPEHSGECRLSRPRLPTKGVNAPPPAPQTKIFSPSSARL